MAQRTSAARRVGACRRRPAILALLGAFAIGSCDGGVDPLVPVATTITLVESTVSFSTLGATRSLQATVRDQAGQPMPGASVSYSSLNERVATVLPSGVVTAVSNGSAQIEVTSGTASATATVTVQQVVATLDVAPDSVVFDDLGGAVTLAAVAMDSLGSTVAGASLDWSATDALVASVDSAGTVTSVATGITYVRAAGGTARDSVLVRVLPELTLEAASPDSLDVSVGGTIAMWVRVEAGGVEAWPGATVDWSVVAGGGAIESAARTPSDQAGLAAGLWRLGTTAGLQQARASIQTRGSTIEVDFVASAFAAPAVIATLQADSVLLSARGETAYLLPAFEDAYGNSALASAASWVSTEPAVASVSPDGLVTGQSAGSAWIRASLATPTDSVLVTVVPRGAITITFDDGWLSAYENGKPVMDEFGLDGNIGVYTEAVGWPGYMSEGQLQQVHDEGWTLVSHTVTHDSLTTVSDPVLDWELRQSRQWLLDRGFDRGADIFVAPYHDFGPRERLATSTYYQASRGASANAVVPDSLVLWQPTNPYELTGIDVDQLPYTTPVGRAHLRTILERTLAEGRFIDVFFHQVPPANVDAMRATLAIVDEFRDRVLPYHRLYPDLARVVH